MSSQNTLTGQSIKYAAVGLANTAITAIIIFIFMHIGFSLYFSNAMGYIVGIIFSFILNSLFTFSTKMSKTTFIKFLCSCLVCYLANLIAIKLFLFIFASHVYIAQLSGMAVYTITGFIINKYWVMK